MRKGKVLLAMAASAASLPAGVGTAQAATLLDVTPTYSRSRQDCRTSATATTSGSAWAVKSGCDNYFQEFYERPITQTLERNAATGGGKVLGAVEYQSNLDIVRARAGADANFLFVGIEMAGLDKVTENGVITPEGLIYRYQFIFSPVVDGATGWLFEVDAPAKANGGSELARPNTVFSTDKTRGYEDENGDVGGSGTNNGLFVVAQGGNGFERNDQLNDGQLQLTNPKQNVLYARVNPNKRTEVEFALRYAALGYDRNTVDAIIAGAGYFDFRSIKGGPNDPQNYLWNDKYTFAEAGSPYKVGTQNLYLLDTLRGLDNPVPEPQTWAMMIIGFGLIGGTMRSQRVSANLRAA